MSRIKWVVCGAALALFPAPPNSSAIFIIHRYSFTSDASDSVGSAHGTLQGGASVSGGQVVLDGTDDYVSLPIGGTIAGLGNSTFQAWVTLDTNPTWARLFDFGTGTSVYMMMTTRRGGPPGAGNPATAISLTGSSGEQPITTASGFPVGSEVFVAMVIDADNTTGRLYINGSLAAENTSMTLKPSDLGTTTQNWLGRSQFNDPYLDGSINEFRIYDGVMAPSQIADSYTLGPDVAWVPEPSSVALLGFGATLCALWRRRKNHS